jgi:hypothetical protein
MASGPILSISKDLYHQTIVIIFNPAHETNPVFKQELVYLKENMDTLMTLSLTAEEKQQLKRDKERMRKKAQKKRRKEKQKLEQANTVVCPNCTTKVGKEGFKQHVKSCLNLEDLNERPKKRTKKEPSLLPTKSDNNTQDEDQSDYNCKTCFKIDSTEPVVRRCSNTVHPEKGKYTAVLHVRAQKYLVCNYAHWKDPSFRVLIFDNCSREMEKLAQDLRQTTDRDKTETCYKCQKAVTDAVRIEAGTGLSVLRRRNLFFCPDIRKVGAGSSVDVEGCIFDIMPQFSKKMWESECKFQTQEVSERGLDKLQESSDKKKTKRRGRGVVMNNK